MPQNRIILDMRYPVQNLAMVEAVILRYNEGRKDSMVCFGKSETGAKLGKMDYRADRFSEFTTTGALIPILKFGNQEWGFRNMPTYRVSPGGAVVQGYGGGGIPDEVLTMVLAATPADLPNVPIIDLPPDPALVLARLKAQGGGSLFGRKW